jgi:hypothetical protein
MFKILQNTIMSPRDSNLRRTFLAGAACVCALGVALLLGMSVPQAAATEIAGDRLYAPTFSFGNPRGKHRVLFLWSTRSPESMKAFVQLIWPLIRDEVSVDAPARRKAVSQRKNYSVVLHQLPDLQGWNVGTGAALLCADRPQDYAAAAFAYMTAAVSTAPPPARPWGAMGRLTYELDEQVVAALKRANVADPVQSRCFDSMAFHARMIPFLRLGDALKQQGADAAAIFANGRRLASPTSVMLQQALR